MSRKVNIEKTVSKIEALQTKINTLLANIKDAVNPEEATRRGKDRIVRDDSELHARVRKNAKKPNKETQKKTLAKEMKAKGEKHKQTKKNDGSYAKLAKAIMNTKAKNGRPVKAVKTKKAKASKKPMPVKTKAQLKSSKRKHVELTGD
jgi:hypothetical protein